MSHPARVVVLFLALANAGCPDPDQPGSPSGECSPDYTMKGDSEATLELMGPAGDVEDITFDSSRCNSGVNVTVTHDDERALLLTPPTNGCVSRPTGSNTDEVSFLYKQTCACAAPWDWLITDSAPPVKIKVEIRPVSSGCAGG